jgi:hypothetical protein
MDRFDLENHITNLHSIVDSLNDISFGILEGDFTKDETVNAVDGLAVLTKAKIEKLFGVFTQVFKLDQYQEDAFDYSQLGHSPEEWI